MSSAQTANPTMSTTARRVRLETVVSLTAVVVATIAAAGLCLHALSAKSFWTDEGVSAAFIHLDWYNFARILWRREANMALYYLLLRAWGQLGDSVAWIRALSVIQAVATVPFLYVVTRRLFGTAAGVVAAILLAVNAYHVRYAQEARSYSLVTFLVTVATYFFVRAVQKRHRRDWTWYVVSSVLALYAHFFAVLVIVAHWVSLKAVRPTVATTADAHPQSAKGRAPYSSMVLRDFYWAVKRIALWTLPVWFFIATTGAGPIRWLQRPGLKDLYWFFEEFAGNAGTPLFWLYLACGVLAVIAAGRAWLRSRRSPETWHYAVALAWFLVPVLISLVFSLARPVFLPRYLIVSLPGLVVCAAAGLLSFRQRWMAAPVVALMVWFALNGVHSYYKFDFDITREDYKSVAAYVIERAQPGDAVLFYKGQGRFAYSYYVGHLPAVNNRPTIISPGHGDRPEWRDFMGKVTPQALESATRDYRRVWLVLSQNLVPRGEDQTTQQIKTAIAGRYRLVDRHEFTGITVYLYAP
jgi:mannosyltransferase